ncbi:hypothetical protein LEMLEM_LOCUS17392, partial [Lemmus lemmus]
SKRQLLSLPSLLLPSVSLCLPPSPSPTSPSPPLSLSVCVCVSFLPLLFHNSLNKSSHTLHGMPIHVSVSQPPSGSMPRASCL